MFNLKVHQAQLVSNIFDVIYTSSNRSVLLIASALVLSTFFGILRGMIEGYRSKRHSFRSMGTLILFSLPDVLIVLAGLWLNVYIYSKFPAIKEALPLSDFILPLLTLSLIPMIYISRITFIATQDELSKDYIKNAKAKGYSRMRIFVKELLPAISFKIIDSMPAIMTMLLSNVLIVEYLFNYNGILYYLFYLYEREDVYRFVPLAITLGLIYMVFTYGIILLGRLVNPLKRGGSR
jgi:ABC-type dipeptide/oligopeptide/nickel transport system permease component